MTICKQEGESPRAAVTVNHFIWSGLKGTLLPIFRITFKNQKTGDSKTLVQFRLKLPNQFFETIIKCVWLRIVRMRIAAS